MAETVNPQQLSRSARINELRRDYKKTQYDTRGLMYPSDLMGENGPYGGNYVIFYVSVHQDSVLSRGKPDTEFVDAANVTRGQQSELSGVSAGGLTAAVLAVGATTGYASGVSEKVARGLGVDLTDRGSTVGKVVDTVGGAAVGAAVIGAVGRAKSAYKQQKRAIALYVPTDLQVKYGVTWEETSLAGTTALAMIMEGAGKALAAGTAGAAVGALAGAALGGRGNRGRGAMVGAALGGGLAGSVTLGATAGPVAANYGAGLALQVPGAGEALSKASGVAANPKKEQLFKAVDYRTFSFTYQFFPRSPEEAANVRDIITEFKLHMHPEFKDATGNFLYIYPSEFDIVYYQNGKENLNFPRHTSCVLTDMSVAYTPQGILTTFPDGMPTQINVSLTFKELALLTKESILNGY